MCCPADPDPHVLADCFDATHAALLGPETVRAVSRNSRAAAQSSM
jgi:hypothetical protein